EAFHAFDRIGRGTIPTLRDLIKHQDIRVRTLAASALWDLTHEAPLVLPVLKEGLQSRYRAAKIVAAAALGRVGAPAKETLDVLKKLAADQTEHEYVHRAAQAAIEMMGAALDTPDKP